MSGRPVALRMRLNSRRRVLLLLRWGKRCRVLQLLRLGRRWSVLLLLLRLGRRWSVLLLLLCLGMRCRVLLRRGGICGGRSWSCGRRRERDAVVLAMVGGLNVGLLGLHGGSCR